MSYIKRLEDGRAFEVFGTATIAYVPFTQFMIFDGKWIWVQAPDFEPLEVLVPDDFEDDDEDEGDDNELHSPIPPKEDKL